MSHNALVDLTGSSDEERSVQNRTAGSKRLKLHSNGRYSIMKGSNLVDLTGEDQDFPYLQTGTLAFPFPQSQQKAYRPPILVDRVSDFEFMPPDATLNLSNQAPVYKDMNQMLGALMELNGRPWSHTTVSRSSVLDEGQEGFRIVQQPVINADLSSPLSKKASYDNEETLTQDYTSRLAKPVETPISATKNQNQLPQMHEDLRIPSPVAVNYVTPDIERQSAEIEEPKELPLTLEAFQEVLKKCLHELRGDHQYYIKSRLAQARQRHTSCTAVGKSRVTATATTADLSDPTSSKRSDFSQRSSPFTNLVQVRRDKDGANIGQQWTGKLCQLGAKATKQSPDIITASCITYSAGNVAIPPYTNYISTKRNILIEDDKNRTFLPYYGDDTAIDHDSADLESRITRNRSHYHHNNSIAEKAKLYGPYAESFLAKIGCNVSMVLRYLLDETSPPAPKELTTNLATMWLNRESYLNEGYYDDSEESDSSTTRHHLKVGRPQKQWQAVLNSLPPPSTSREAAAACIACTAFANVLDFSLWHVVKRHRLASDAVNRKHRTTDINDRGSGATNGLLSSSLSPTRDSDPLGTYADLGCLVCYAHECPGHGEFEDDDEEKNVRVRINAKPPSPESSKDKIRHHLTDEEHTRVVISSSDAAVGINEDNSITGKPWALLKSEDSGFKDEETCSDKCFWLKSNRLVSSSSWNDHDLKLFDTLLPAHQGNRRGSCLLALSMNKPCNEVFLKVLRAAHMTSSLVPKRHGSTISQNTRHPPRKHFDYWLEHSITWEHHERPPFKPCSHFGPCNTSTDCRCHHQQVTCEKTCLCSDDCSRRYRGCTCAARGKVCWQNDRCDCYRLNRECDPDLCQSCGAHEVLDPANRYRNDLAEGKCTNVYVQRGVPRRTLLGHSKLMASGGVSGWGLYMGEATKKGDYIGEYVGEVISKEESEQRGIIYNKRNLSYLFDLNSTQTLDSTFVGNKLRYINHQAPPYANCRAKTLFCNTVHRIGMFACRNIEVGEEILFDYGEGFAAKFDLIKLNDQAQPTIQPRRKGVAHKINKDPNRAPTLSKNGKRIGRPRKSAFNDQDVRGSAVMVETAPEPKAKSAATAAKRSHKRKIPLPDPGIDAVVDDQDFEDILPSEDLRDDASSDSYHWSNDGEDEFKVTRPSLIESSRKRGWRSRMSSRGQRKGRGNSMGSSVVMRDARKLSDRGLEISETRGLRIPVESPGEAASKTHTSDSFQERRDGPTATSHDIYEFGTPQRHGWETRHRAKESGKEKGKERDASDRVVAELRAQLDRLKGGYMDDAVQAGSSSTQHADERHENEEPQHRGTRTRTMNSLTRRPGGG